MLRGQGVFFFLWPLFARAPRHWFLENFLLSAPGVQSVFFFVALRWAPRPFGGARAKKKHHPGCFFLLWPRAGAQRGFSFPCLSPGPEQKKKKKNTLGGFFCSGPSRRPTGLLLPLPFAGAAAKKKTPWVVFFFAPAPCRHGASPSPAFPRGRSQKKTPWVFFFFCWLRPRADAHSLTAGLGGDASPSPGWCFFFCCGPARTGLVFFFAVAPPGRSLTHCGLGRFRQGPGGVYFFAAAPPGLFRQ